MAPKYESTGILNATGKIFCLNVHRSIHQIIHRSIRSIHIHQVFSWNRYAHADWMPLAARAAKTIRTPGWTPWAAILCEPGSNCNTKCQKTTVMEDPQVFCYELIWAWTTKKKRGKKTSHPTTGKQELHVPRNWASDLNVPPQCGPQGPCCGDPPVILGTEVMSLVVAHFMQPDMGTRTDTET